MSDIAITADMPVADRRRALVQALRSGKYRQGRRKLCTADNPDSLKYCCLGVACDIYKQAHPKARWSGGTGTRIFFPGLLGDETAILPIRVRDWFGFSATDGRFTGGSLTWLNDHGRSFEQIATIIENSPTGLFIDNATSPSA